jgi:hypothetical protein
MAAERSIPVQVDHAQINLDDNLEINYWAESLGVSHDVLNDLVREAGTIVDDIEAALQRRWTGENRITIVANTPAAKYRSPMRAQAPKCTDPYRS